LVPSAPRGSARIAAKQVSFDESRSQYTRCHWRRIARQVHELSRT
jgi:hypothetical protein